MTYRNAILSDSVVLVEFYASWCPHCQKMMPIVDDVRELLGTRAEVEQYDIDAHPSDADLAKVDTVPTFIIYAHGEEKWRYSGEIDGNVLLQKVESYL